MSACMSDLGCTAKADMICTEIEAAFFDYRLSLHILLNMASLAPKGGLQLYGPSIIRTLGFSKKKGNALNSTRVNSCGGCTGKVRAKTGGLRVN
ncbi:hypothetical protein G6011_05814 [Alternaria panax]|uniref:Uncharacterized protein n=1 Tax=Alternaria panax TaxID=48097 RepID=A0AAD4FFZ8_9PLEO|nr:hypothetical protein G6011_05814 [Alternaria panax]